MIDLSLWDGASSGLLDEAHVTEVGAAIEPGSVAAILIYEILWEIALAETLAQHGARSPAARRSRSEISRSGAPGGQKEPGCEHTR